LKLRCQPKFDFGVVQENANTNLLVALHKYAHHQDENFTTEAFAHLLRHLVAFDPGTACSLFDCLSGGGLRLTAGDCPTLGIKTQQTDEAGRPDIWVEGPTQLVIIEVKVESEPGLDQLDRYRDILNWRTSPINCCC